MKNRIKSISDMYALIRGLGRLTELEKVSIEYLHNTALDLAEIHRGYDADSTPPPLEYVTAVGEIMQQLVGFYKNHNK